MNGEIRRDVLTPLRELDEHYAKHEPPPGAESRLLARLKPERRASSRPLGLAWSKIRRPLVFLGACVLMIVIVWHDDLQEAKRTHFQPKKVLVPAASTPLHEVPLQPLRQEKPTFHDAILPAPSSTYDAPPEVPRVLPQWPNTVPSDDDFVEKGRTYPEPLEPLFFPRRSNSFEKHSPQSSSNGPVEMYWSTPGEGKRDIPFMAGGDSPRSEQSKATVHKAPAPRPSGPSAPCRSLDALKQEADLDCSEKGLTLSEITLLDACGNGQFRREKHECVETDLEACVTNTIGDGSVCLDPGDVKLHAYEACTNSGQQLIDFVVVGDDCNGKIRMAKFTCCTPETPQSPAPAPSCQKWVPSDMTTCRDLGTLKQTAMDICTAEDAVLVDTYFWGDCPGGQASQMVAVCCDK